jgi:CelD/BcsL family acetyltransferase involved in cellulose biosynthesis
MARTRHHGVARLQLLGTRPTYEPGRLVFRDRAALDSLVEDLVATGRPLHLGRLAEGSAELAAVTALPRRRAVVVSRTAPGTPRLTLPDDPSALDRALSASRRTALRRARRRAEQEGALAVDVVAPGPDTAGEQLDRLVQVEAKGWKGRAGTALFHDTALRRFFSSYAGRAAELGTLRMSFLRIGEATAAAQLAVEVGDRLWVLKIGYDEAWSRVSPGVLLTHETIRWAVGRELAAYEFLGGEAPWITAWTSEVVPHRTVRVYPRSAAGLAGLAADAVRR